MAWGYSSAVLFPSSQSPLTYFSQGPGDQWALEIASLYLPTSGWKAPLFGSSWLFTWVLEIKFEVFIFAKQTRTWQSYLLPPPHKTSPHVYLFLYFFILCMVMVCVCLCVSEHTCATVHVEVRRLFPKLVLAFHHVILGPGSQAWWQAPLLGGKHPYMLSHLASLKNVILCDWNIIAK